MARTARTRIPLDSPRTALLRKEMDFDRDLSEIGGDLSQVSRMWTVALSDACPAYHRETPYA